MTPLTCHTQGCFYFHLSFQLQPLCRWASQELAQVVAFHLSENVHVTVSLP